MMKRLMERPVWAVVGAVCTLAAATVPMYLTDGAIASGEGEVRRYIQLSASTKEDRTAIANMGVSIEFISSDTVWGFADRLTIRQLEEQGYKLLSNQDIKVARGGHEGLFDFPREDERFHNYEELTTALNTLAARHSDIARISSIGKSIEGRDLWAIHINTTPEALESGHSGKPGVIFMGTHHAREHVSTEIPLMFAQHLLGNRSDARVSSLLDGRDIWIIPMVNPDGVEHDIAHGDYKMWRKNRRRNSDGSYGVDLNRNYGFQWGTGGSSTNPRSDVYMGTEPFSEPETQAIRDFVKSKTNTKILLSFHTFSELILYPWGHKYDPIENDRDLRVFQTMAQTMSQWNRYTPQPSSDLYIASGDTTDWAYGELGIFALTFELSPRSMWEGGFYPGQRIIDRVFNDNLRPMLYMLDVANDPYQVLGNEPHGFLRNIVEPAIPASLMWEAHPIQ